jgi:hypothetical protein
VSSYPGEHRPFVTELLDKVEATGYTIIGNISGKGHHGVREAHFMFSEQESLIMIMAVVPEEKGRAGARRTPAAVRPSFRCDVRVGRGRQPARLLRQEKREILKPADREAQPAW